MTYIEKTISYCNQNPEDYICNLTQKQFSYDILFSNYDELLSKSKNSCEKNYTDSMSCTFMANNCILSSESTDFCNRFRGISTNYSCIQYQQSYKEIFRDITIPQSFDYSTIVKIVVASFTPTGEFIGYFPLKNEIQNCGSRHYEKNVWKKFGRNYYEKCSLNISKLSLNFYEPFLFIEDQNLLIQIPVLPTNYIRNGEKVNNNDKNKEYYQFFNRFFLYDNYSHKKTQYASEISFIFYVQEKDHHQIHVPYLTVTYENIHDSSTIQNFDFSAKYLLEDSSFKNLSIIIMIIFIILGIGYFIASFMITVRTLYSDGASKYIVFLILSNLFDSISYSLFFVSFFLGFYILCGYKWTNHLYMCLGSTNDYSYLYILIYISFFLKLFGTIFRIINQSSGTFHAIDWDQRSSSYNYDSKSKFISRSRQNILANEWLKLSTVRGIDTAFIIIFVLLIIRGFKMYLLQQPIPTIETIDVGKKYLIIEVGLTSFIWILTSFLFWLLKRFVYWNIFGNPFTNFQQLCLSLNISALMMMNNTRGFLINGKQAGHYSQSHLINSYDYQYNSDPENKIQDDDDYDLSQYKSTTYSTEIINPLVDDTDNENEVKIFINTNENEDDNHFDQSPRNLNNSNSEKSEPQKVQVDLNSTHEKELKKNPNPLSQKGLRVKFIDQNYKKIDNVGMEVNDYSDPTKKSKNNNNFAKSKDKNSTDSDVDIDIDSNSDSDNLPNKTDKSDSSSKEDLNDKKSPENNSDIIIEEEEEASDSIDNNKIEINQKTNNIDDNLDQIEIPTDSKQIIQSSIKMPISIPTNDDLDSNVVNDNDQTASKALKKFQFNPVNLLEKEEEESENDTNSSSYNSDLISDSHLSEISISKEYSNTQNNNDNDSSYSENTKPQVKPKKKSIKDIVPKLDPLDKKYRGNNQVFEIFLDSDFFHYANKSEEVIDIILENNKNKIYSENTKSITELKEETNSTWRSLLLNENVDYSYLIETMSVAQSIFNVGPVSALKSVFTIQNDTSFKDSMLYGIEGSLIFFYLILFVCIEMISNASIAGLIVFIVDILIIKIFKWKRRNYLLNREYSPYKSLVR